MFVGQTIPKPKRKGTPAKVESDSEKVQPKTRAAIDSDTEKSIPTAKTRAAVTMLKKLMVEENSPPRRRGRKDSEEGLNGEGLSPSSGMAPANGSKRGRKRQVSE